MMAKPDVKGKIAFISGGSSGIGEEMAKQMIRLGAKKVIIAARRLDELERVKKETQHPDKVQVFQLDLSNPQECLAKTKELFAKEPIDILVNNGGISQRDSFDDLDFEVCERMMNVNCTSHIAVIKAALPGMTQRKSGQIVNISSLSGIAGLPVRTMYSASKFAIRGFANGLRAEMKPYGIDVINIYPDYVQTNISSNAMTGDGQKFGKLDSNIAKGITVQNCVTQILKAMAIKKIELIVGRTWTQFIPLIVSSSTVMDWQMDKKYKS